MQNLHFWATAKWWYFESNSNGQNIIKCRHSNALCFLCSECSDSTRSRSLCQKDPAPPSPTPSIVIVVVLFDTASRCNDHPVSWFIGYWQCNHSRSGPLGQRSQSNIECQCPRTTYFGTTYFGTPYIGTAYSVTPWSSTQRIWNRSNSKIGEFTTSQFVRKTSTRSLSETDGNGPDAFCRWIQGRCQYAKWSEIKWKFITFNRFTVTFTQTVVSSTSEFVVLQWTDTEGIRSILNDHERDKETECRRSCYWSLFWVERTWYIFDHFCDFMKFGKNWHFLSCFLVWTRCHCAMMLSGYFLKLVCFENFVLKMLRCDMKQDVLWKCCKKISK